MPTLYVRDVPEELYEQLRRQAHVSRRSISAEAVAVLGEAFSSRSEVSLDEFLEHADSIRARTRRRSGGPSVVDLIRGDRER